MKTLEELHKIREEKRRELDLRVNTKADVREKHILVCHGTGCTSSKSPEILEKFRKICPKLIDSYIDKYDSYGKKSLQKHFIMNN